HTPLPQRVDGTWQVASGQCLPGVSDRDRPVHERTRVTIAGHSAGVAGLPLIGELVEVEDRSHGLCPGFATPDVQIPIEVKILVASDARNQLLLAADRASDLVQ